jgi:uncharacterized surface protein with fasciclin (FAS1) repeats
MKMLMMAAGAALALAAAPSMAATQNKADTVNAAAGGNIVATAKAAGDFTTLTKAIETAGLAGDLSAAGPYTVFAPTDAAFAKLPAGTVDNLLKPENREQLRTLLKAHVVSGQAKADYFAGKTGEMTSLGGTKLALDGTSGVKVNGASVVKADIAASNGIIHAIDTVLLPPTQAAVAAEPDQGSSDQ